MSTTPGSAAKGYTFAETKRIGKWACKQIAAYYQGRGYEVTDVEDDPLMQTFDIDLIVEGEGERPFYVEVKGDRYTTDNVYIERISNIAKGTPGCLLYTVADIVCYYFVQEGRAIVIPVKPLQEWIPRRLCDFKSKNPATNIGKEEMYRSIGHPVPVRVMLEEVGATVIEGLPVKEID